MSITTSLAPFLMLVPMLAGQSIFPAVEAVRSFSFVTFTDTHFFPASTERSRFLQKIAGGPAEALRVRESEQVVKEVLAEMAAVPAAQFVVHTGDIVCGGGSFGDSSDQYQMALRQFWQLERAALGDRPLHHIPGNHDVDPELGGLDTWVTIFGGERKETYRWFDWGGLRFVLLNTMDGLDNDVTVGNVGPQQLQWLDSTLHDAASHNRSALLFLHHLVVPPNWVIANRPGEFVKNAADLLQVLDGHSNVVAAFSGHVHMNSRVERNGVTWITTASTHEWPMQWKQVDVQDWGWGGQLRVSSHSLNITSIRQLSKGADDRAGENDLKQGHSLERDFDISFTHPGH